MTLPWANEFSDISSILLRRDDLRSRMLSLAASAPIPGKVTEEAPRLVAFRGVLSELVQGGLIIEAAYSETARRLPRGGSAHRDNNRVFPENWEERLVRTQFSRFYNQAALEWMMTNNIAECYVPHSAEEDADSPCSRLMAGRVHSVSQLHSLLVSNYGEGRWSSALKIPNHPHCTHVVRPRLPSDKLLV